MKISPEEMAHVAALSRLHLEPEEQERLATDLGSILQYMEKLSQLDTKDIEPTAHVVAGAGHWREDRAGDWGDADLLLENAPERVGRQFKVPRIIE